MNSFLSTLALLSALTLTSTAMAGQTPATKEVPIAVSEVYIPGGFSANTDAYVIVSGMFPNSCYSWGRVDVTSPSPKFHELRAMATVSQQMCLMVLVPYTREVKLGRLETGEHTLRFVNNDGTYFEKTLKVE